MTASPLVANPDLDSVGRVSVTEKSWSSSDALLYALAVGAGQADPVGFEREFTTENSLGLAQRVLPAYAAVLAQPPALCSIEGLDWSRAVHGEQRIEMYGEIPPAGTIVTETRAAAIQDKRSGALVVFESISRFADSWQPAFATRIAVFLRGQGGFGTGRGAAITPRATVPTRKPDLELEYSTRRDQALLYRLCGDRSPLHSDPAVSGPAGFATPTLHGLCTYGCTGRVLMHSLCDSDPGRFGVLDARFTAPAWPGESFRVRVWRVEAGAVRFQTVAASGAVVIDAGSFTYDT